MFKSNKQMKVAAFIPTRGDRPQFLERALHYAKRQTVPVDVFVVDFPPVSNRPDLGKRFKAGCEMTRGYDLTFVWEDDDWYSPEYVQTVLELWEEAGRPDLFGCDWTLYYHIAGRQFHQEHKGRSSLFTTCFTDEGKDQFRVDDIDVFVDLKIWNQVKNRATYSDCRRPCNRGGCYPNLPIALGIKHGIGLCGGKAHNPEWKGYLKPRKPSAIAYRNPTKCFPGISLDEHIEMCWRDQRMEVLELIGNEDYDFYNRLAGV